MPGGRVTTLRYSSEDEPDVRELLDEVQKARSVSRAFQGSMGPGTG